ncbi:MAG: sugar ABC transporter permease [Thermoleophilia bacterium]
MSTAEQDPRLQVDAEGLAGLWTRFTRRVREGELGSLPVIIGLIIIWTVFAVSEENFLTAGNLTNLMLQIAGLGIIATGVVMVLLLGEIDLSVGIVSGLAASVMAVLSVKQDWPGWAAIVAALLVGLGAGLFQGVFITFFRVPSFVVTLAGLLGFQGLLLYVLGDTGTINLTDSQIIDLANTFYSDYVGWIIAIVLLVPYVLLTLNGYRRRLAAGLDTGPPILLALRMAVVIAGVIVAVLIFNADRGVPLAVLIFIGIVILVDFVLRHTAFGRHVYAVGGNAEAARRAGISLSRIRLIVFASCSTLAAAGGVLLASRLFAVNQGSGGSDLLLNAIAAAVIGGVSLFGGRGTAWAALLGALVIGSISNGMDLMALDSDIKFMVTGAVLLLAVTVDATARRGRQSAGRA